MSQQLNRRDFVKTSVVGASMAAVAGMPVLAGGVAVAEEQKPIVAKQQVPAGKVGKLTMGRMLLGGNLLTHYTHSRDLKYVYNLAAHYNTQEKIFETMRIAEAHGVNAVVIHTAKGVLQWMSEYKKQGGKMQFIVCPTANIKDDMKEFTKACKECVDAGVDSLYLWGVRSDQLIKRPDLIKKAVETMRSFDITVGVAAHKLGVIEVCEQEKIECDFYLKTFHHHNYPSVKLNHDSSWCDEPDKVIEVMSKVEKPWIAFKIMAAGAIPPKNALEYAFSNGADFTVFGM
ncbi:MAG: hypothetical protein LBL62_04230, partial [Planctomycetaceae bacterium]|nr:hypothetical protein [Planctomycetaceae bacterium]